MFYLHLSHSVGNDNCKREHTSYWLEMDQNLEQRDLGKNTANQVPIRETDGREKSNKCYQCDSSFSQAGHLRTHMKTQAIVGKSQTNATNVIMSLLGQAI